MVPVGVVHRPHLEPDRVAHAAGIGVAVRHVAEDVWYSSL
jgi:hypothetical protein